MHRSGPRPLRLESWRAASDANALGVDRMDQQFSVQLDGYRGPIDLLLYLVRKHEVSATSIPIADITRQYLEYLELLEAIDIDSVGDFLEVASLLIEIKSRDALPRVEETGDEAVFEDPREELVARLLEYQGFRDAASMLDDRARQWQQRFSRRAHDLTPRKIDPADQPITDVETWDLVSAFGRIMRDHAPPPVTNIVYDDTPITRYMERIHARVCESGKMRLGELFDAGLHKSAMIGVFLAVLELARHHGIRPQQEGLYGDIWVVPGDGFKRELDLSQVDHYDPRLDGKGDPASMVK